MHKFKKIMAVLAVMLPTCFTVQMNTYAMKENNEFQFNDNASEKDYLNDDVNYENNINDEEDVDNNIINEHTINENGNINIINTNNNPNISNNISNEDKEEERNSININDENNEYEEAALNFLAEKSVIKLCSKNFIKHVLNELNAYDDNIWNKYDGYRNKKRENSILSSEKFLTALSNHNIKHVDFRSYFDSEDFANALSDIYYSLLDYLKSVRKNSSSKIKQTQKDVKDALVDVITAMHNVAYGACVVHFERLFSFDNCYSLRRVIKNVFYILHETGALKEIDANQNINDVLVNHDDLLAHELLSCDIDSLFYRLNSNELSLREPFYRYSLGEDLKTDPFKKILTNLPGSLPEFKNIAASDKNKDIIHLQKANRFKRSFHDLFFQVLRVECDALQKTLSRCIGYYFTNEI